MSDYTCKESTIKDIERLEFLVLSGLDKECEGVMGGYNPSSFLRGLSYGLERANEIISNQPTVDEKEIIRKAFERVLERFKTEKERHDKDCSYWSEHSWKDEIQFNECDMSRIKSEFFEEAIEIVKEECGISE